MSAHIIRLARQDDRMRSEPYPSWDYFPRNARPPEWVEPFIANVRAAQQSISTVERKTGLDSDHVLQQLAAGLRELGFAVESGKKASERIRRPVLFGSNGHAAVSYEIDAFHLRPFSWLPQSKGGVPAHFGKLGKSGLPCTRSSRSSRVVKQPSTLKLLRIRSYGQ